VLFHFGSEFRAFIIVRKHGSQCMVWCNDWSVQCTPHYPLCSVFVVCCFRLLPTKLPTTVCVHRYSSKIDINPAPSQSRSASYNYLLLSQHTCIGQNIIKLVLTFTITFTLSTNMTEVCPSHKLLTTRATRAERYFVNFKKIPPNKVDYKAPSTPYDSNLIKISTVKRHF